MIELKDWKEFFPYAEPRAEQIEAINFILNTFDSGKRFAIADLGTGVGKSAIGVTVARYLTSKTLVDGGAWFLTTQKILQEQYINDFGQQGQMKSIKSSNNYQCKQYRTLTCAEGQQMVKVAPKNSQFWTTCVCNCTYKKAKEEFLKSSESITNFSYAMIEANYHGGIKRRKLLVVDESHNLSSELGRIVEILISSRMTAQVNLDWPAVTTHHQAVKWIQTVYLPKCKEELEELTTQVEEYKSLTTAVKEYAELCKRANNMQSHVDKLTTFLQYENEDNWLFEIFPEEENYAKLTFRPVDIAPYAEPFLFRLGEKVLLMSATMINCEKFAESAGIKPSDYAALVIPSPFPEKNRPVYTFSAGNMTMDHIDKSLPNVVEVLSEILNEHKKEKGIVHATSYKIANYIKKNLKNKRLIFHEASDREDALEKHLTSKEPTVLVSPSMTEGVDLKDDLSRFQVIMKVPYPSLGDKLVRKRMARWSWWYPLQVVKSIVQAVGRSIRSEKDYAVTYILDSDWQNFYRKHKHLFPEYFRKVVQDK